MNRVDASTPTWLRPSNPSTFGKTRKSMTSSTNTTRRGFLSTAAALTPQTAAILVESIQGESGITAASPEYLLGLRKLCDEQNLLLLLDEVQAGHFRTGSFHGWQRVLENVSGAENFLPDAISMAKSLGGGFPIGAFWVRDELADVLSAGTHA